MAPLWPPVGDFPVMVLLWSMDRGPEGIEGDPVEALRDGHPLLAERHAAKEGGIHLVYPWQVEPGEDLVVEPRLRVLREPDPGAVALRLAAGRSVAVLQFRARGIELSGTDLAHTVDTTDEFHTMGGARLIGRTDLGEPTWDLAQATPMLPLAPERWTLPPQDPIVRSPPARGRRGNTGTIAARAGLRLTDGTDQSVIRSTTMSGRKALVLGGTGAMGVYLVPELAALGYDVQVVSLDNVVSGDPRITYTKADAKNVDYLEQLLEERLDVIVDFMLYSTEQFRERCDLLLRNTDHYIFLSSYRVYDGDDVPITEDTPRLLDASGNAGFLATDDYSLTKARQEDILQSSERDNWTIVRPAITYSKRRFQLVTLEAHIVVARALKGLPVVLPKEALSVQATMSWAGDVARLMSRLLLNPSAYLERFTLATAEHRTWGEIAEYYREIIGLEYVGADTEDYLRIMGGSRGARYQLAYDRLFERIVDNTKVLRVTGLKQEDFMPLRCGLEKELSALPRDTVWRDARAVWERMDSYAKGME